MTAHWSDETRAQAVALAAVALTAPACLWVVDAVIEQRTDSARFARAESLQTAIDTLMEAVRACEIPRPQEATV